MRLLLSVIALCAVALPAMAQRVDTRRYDLRDVDGITACKFNAVDGLMLTQFAAGPGTNAIWHGEADGAVLDIGYAPQDGSARIVGFDLAVMDPGPAQRTARLYLDDQATSFALEPGDTDHGFHFFLDQAQWGDIVQQMMTHSTARLEMLDASGKLLHSYSWDIFKLRRIPELLDLVHWGCRTPDRG